MHNFHALALAWCANKQNRECRCNKCRPFRFCCLNMDTPRQPEYFHICISALRASTIESNRKITALVVKRFYQGHKTEVSVCGCACGCIYLCVLECKCLKVCFAFFVPLRTLKPQTFIACKCQLSCWQARCVRIGVCVGVSVCMCVCVYVFKKSFFTLQ